MLCPNCSKLIFTYKIKKCHACQAEITNNLSVICENCSTRNFQCSICLRKLKDPTKDKSGRCGRCGGN